MDTDTEEPGQIPNAGGALPSALEQKIAQAVDDVLSVLAAAEKAAARPNSPTKGRLLAKYRGPFTAAMSALGEALAQAAENDPHENIDRQSDRQSIQQIRAIMSMSAVVRRAQDWLNDEEEGAEVQREALEGKIGGFDISSRLINENQQGSHLARSYRNRGELLGRHLRDEIHRRVDEGQVPVEVLCLRSGSALELVAALQDPVSARAAALTLVDPSTNALRRTRHHFAGLLNRPPKLIRADPATLHHSPSRPRKRFDIVYSLGMFDVLQFDGASELLAAIRTFLKPDGVLITGGFGPNAPRAEEAFAAVVLGADIVYRDRAAWDQLLFAGSFDPQGTVFSTDELATIVLTAPQRKAIPDV
jgi:SAM-dependent methyltransferase